MRRTGDASIVIWFVLLDGMALSAGIPDAVGNARHIRDQGRKPASSDRHDGHPPNPPPGPGAADFFEHIRVSSAGNGRGHVFRSATAPHASTGSGDGKSPEGVLRS
ncbi:hypothetical protein GCM10027184_11430 [Saccharothrix stipae]